MFVTALVTLVELFNSLNRCSFVYERFPIGKDVQAGGDLALTGSPAIGRCLQ